MVDLSTSLKDLELKNPVLTASGTFGFGEEYADFIDLNALGGFVVKGTTLEPWQGNDYPRMAETPMGMLNCVGLQNAGVDHFIEDKWPYLSKLDSVPIVNVSGARIEDYVACAEKLAALDGLKAIELNISCPNVKQGGMAFGTTCDGAASVVSAVREVWPRHLMVKLSPNVTSIVDIAKAVEGAVPTRCRSSIHFLAWLSTWSVADLCCLPLPVAFRALPSSLWLCVWYGRWHMQFLSRLWVSAAYLLPRTLLSLLWQVQAQFR